MCQPSRANRIPKISLMNGSAFCQLRQCLACNIPLDAGTMRRDGGTHPLCDACANHQKMNGIRGGPSGSSTSAGGSAAGSGSGASTGTNNGVRSGGSRGSRVSSSSSSVSLKKTCELRLLQAILSPIFVQHQQMDLPDFWVQEKILDLDLAQEDKLDVLGGNFDKL